MQGDWQSALQHFGVLLLARASRAQPPPSLPLPPFASPALLRDPNLERLSLLISSGPELRPNARTARILMEAALANNDAATASDVFAAALACDVTPDVPLVNLVLQTLARLGLWQQTWQVLQSAWRGVGIDRKSVQIVEDLLAMVCILAAEHGTDFQEHVHELMDEVRHFVHANFGSSTASTIESMRSHGCVAEAAVAQLSACLCGCCR